MTTRAAHDVPPAFVLSHGPDIGSNPVLFESARFSPRMCFRVGFLHSLGGQMRVDLGRRETLVAQKFLDTPQIGTIVQQVCGEAVTQGVW